jgi:hypothetical protein
VHEQLQYALTLKVTEWSSLRESLGGPCRNTSVELNRHAISINPPYWQVTMIPATLVQTCNLMCHIQWATDWQSLSLFTILLVADNLRLPLKGWTADNRNFSIQHDHDSSFALGYPFWSNSPVPASGSPEFLTTRMVCHPRRCILV